MFTQNWNGEIKKNLSFIDRNSLMNVVEIGTFEGLTANYIVKELLAHNGELVCVDPLEDDYELDNDNELFKGQYGRFIENTEPNKERIKLIRESSHTALPRLRDNYFDLVYVDGDHTFNSVTSDAAEAFRITRIGGFILFDDYLWRNGSTYDMKRAIDVFLLGHPNHRLLLKLNQVLIQKLPEGSPTEDGQNEYQDKQVEILFADDKIYAAYCNLDSRLDREVHMRAELRRIGF